MPEFLFEIGLEEVPARMIAGGQAELQRRIVAIAAARAAGGRRSGFASYSTPRRLAVMVRGLLPQQADLSEELLDRRRRSHSKTAHPDRRRWPLRRRRVLLLGALDDLDTPKGEYIVATACEAGPQGGGGNRSGIAERACRYLLGEEYVLAGGEAGAVRAPGALDACAPGQRVVPVTFGGTTAGGDRMDIAFCSGESAVPISSPGGYVEALRGRM